MQTVDHATFQDLRWTILHEGVRIYGDNYPDPIATHTTFAATRWEKRASLIKMGKRANRAHE
ncbi:hypothetical protein GCM10010985_61130 [Caballeronia grimmiae]|uniref:Uncharacterized protein n=1 Tax=Caballeronia grimmiae TaxID=1071679 RepID=A0ABQ1SB64_9BURK|nr:hypothetical protein GCM10010985_61130 [Caballeronia grimmiae]